MSKVPKNWAQTTVKELAGTSGIFVDGDWVESKDQDPNGKAPRQDLGEQGRFRRFSREWIANERGDSLDIAWLKDDAAEDAADLPEPAVLAREAVEELNAAVAELDAILAELGEGA